MKKSQMNATLTAMEDKGLILRKRTSHDKRRMDILLTSKGQQLFEYQHRKILRLIDALVRRLGRTTGIGGTETVFVHRRHGQRRALLFSPF